MATDLVNGIKEKLAKEFREMYPVHGIEWRKKIKAINPWHSTEHGLHAWNNLRSKGNCGSEPMRLIVSDMKKVLGSGEIVDATSVLSDKKIKAIRKKAIETSLRNLGQSKIKAKKTA